jgi:hypothetical protein
MNTQNETSQTSLNRRTVALFGVAGISAMAFGAGRSRDAAAAAPEGITAATLQESESIISGIGKVRLREFTWAPRASGEAEPMGNPMVCRMVQGALDQMVDGKPATRNEGDLWTCRSETVVADTNNGTIPAVMHVIDLLPE